MPRTSPSKKRNPTRDPQRRGETASRNVQTEHSRLYRLRLQGDLKLKSFATVIQQILRLRQICDHGKEMLSFKTLQNMEDFNASQGSKGSILPSAETALCGACGRKVDDFNSLLRCLHPTCRLCSEEKDILTPDGEPECLICASTASQDTSHPDTDSEPETRDDIGVEYRPSSKVTALLKNLRRFSQEPTDLPIKRYFGPLIHNIMVFNIHVALSSPAGPRCWILLVKG